MSVSLSVHPSAWNNSAPSRRIFRKFKIWVFLEKSVVKIQISVKSRFMTVFRSWRSCHKERCKINLVIPYNVSRPASRSSGQSFWLLIMRSRVRFTVLPWGFFLEGEVSHGDHGLCRLVELGFKAPSWYFIFIYHHPPHPNNVTAPHGRPNIRSPLHFGHNRRGDHKVHKGNVVALGEKNVSQWEAS
jgi:hypothetical protein